MASTLSLKLHSSGYSLPILCKYIYIYSKYHLFMSFIRHKYKRICTVLWRKWCGHSCRYIVQKSAFCWYFSHHLLFHGIPPHPSFLTNLGYWLFSSSARLRFAANCVTMSKLRGKDRALKWSSSVRGKIREKKKSVRFWQSLNSLVIQQSINP